MRYFIYKNTDESKKNALSEQYKALNDREKRIFRKAKAWRRFCAAISLVIYIVIVTAGFYLLRSLPQPAGWFGNLFGGIGKTLLIFVILIVSGLLTAATTWALWKRTDPSQLPAMKKDILSKACRHLRDYYSLQEPYLITKCFDATDQRFSGHDVCIFVADNELRITTDLVHGFLHGERDLGCYAFTKQEITLTNRPHGNHVILDLSAEKTTFLLASRAKAFIEKNFIENHSA